MDAKQTVSRAMEHGMSQREIANLTGLSQGEISHIRTGRRKNVLSSTLKKLDVLAAHVESLRGSTSGPEAVA
ncbi:TPA: helix-turn-helix transcriptional regulator [Burkholderia cenocepacia]|nr:helix-turn-helix transcriptional regulator [Burkholderia cenocepacia]